MSKKTREFTSFIIMALLLFAVGVGQSWSVSLAIINMCLISAIMTMGANIQWGYAGLVNFGLMGFTALGGLAAVLVSYSPVREAWSVGGINMIISLLILIAVIFAIRFVLKFFNKGLKRYLIIFAILLFGLLIINQFYRPAVIAIEDVSPAKTGFLGGFGLPIIFSWFVGGLLAAGVAFVIGKITLGLRADYLAIATLGISEIVIAVLKHEDWLTRGVKNVIGLKRPVPYEINLQNSDWFISLITRIYNFKLEIVQNLEEKQNLIHQLVIVGSSIFVKLCYMSLFIIVLLVIFYLSNAALNSPWGRMMRAIRDNEVSANAMGKDIVKRHLQVFVLGSAVVGIAGAMLTTQDGLFTPGSYQPLRFTFLIWVMVIVGGSGNNLGSILGGFVIWFVWIEAAPFALFVIELATSGLDSDNSVKIHLLNSAFYFRYLIMGATLLLIMRYRPKGILPEKTRYV